MQAGFFLAPIIYPLGIMPERFHFYLYLWPPTPIIQFSRAVLVDGMCRRLRAHLSARCEAGVDPRCRRRSIFRRFAPRAAEYL